MTTQPSANEVKQHLEAAERSPREVAAAVSGLPEKTLLYKPSPEKWSILEILSHLADTEIVFAYRIRKILAESAPEITGFPQDDWAKNLHYDQNVVPELVALYGLNRHANLKLLRRATPAELARTATNTTANRTISLAEVIGQIDTHSAKHLKQIESLKHLMTNPHQVI
jgi:hypothetical protein